MANGRTPDRIVCRKHQGGTDLWGGVINEDDLIFVSHAQLCEDESDKYLGHLFIQPKRQVLGPAQLTESEAESIGLYSSRLAMALLNTEGMDHVYRLYEGSDAGCDAARSMKDGSEESLWQPRPASMALPSRRNS